MLKIYRNYSQKNVIITGEGDEMNRRLQEQSAEKLSSYLGDKRLMKMKEYVQHGDVSTYDHAVLVAFYSCMLACRLRLKYDERALIRGALLHDYYLYDWHEKEAWHKWHGFRHPRFAMENAQRDFHLSEKEIEIIRKHMWPLTIIPPRCKEAWIVNGTDTWISLIESAARFRCLSALRRSWIDRPLRLSLRYAEDAGRQASTFTAKEE